jgi:hypothetical protein
MKNLMTLNFLLMPMPTLLVSAWMESLRFAALDAAKGTILTILNVPIADTDIKERKKICLNFRKYLRTGRFFKLIPSFL